MELFHHESRRVYSATAMEEAQGGVDKMRSRSRRREQEQEEEEEEEEE